MSVYVATFAVVLTVANLLANIPVLVVTTFSRKLRTDAVTAIIASVAVNDVGAGALIPGIGAALCFIGPDPVPPPLEYVLGCAQQVFAYCALLHFVLVAAVKCSVIVRPLVYFTVLTDRFRLGAIVAVWALGLLLGMVPAIAGASFAYDATFCLPTTATQTVLQTALMNTAFLSTTLVVLLLYLKIFLVVRRHLRSISGTTLPPIPAAEFEAKRMEAGRRRDAKVASKDGNSATVGIFGQSVRSAKNLFIISGVYILTYIPAFLIIIKVLPLPADLRTWIRLVIKWLYVAASTINGFLYIALHKTVRSELAKIFSRSRRITVEDPSTATATSSRRTTIFRINSPESH